MKKNYFFLFVFLLALKCFATHNRGAEITYTYVSGYTYSISITTYTRTSSPADRPTLDSVHFGDGTQGVFARQYKDSIARDISINFYQENHTYPGQGTYTIYFVDPNRNADLVNIPNSVNVPMADQSYIVVFDPSKYCINNSAYFLTPPILNAEAGKDYHQNVTAVDPDGDSLSYELVRCLAGFNLPVPGYFLPSLISINSFNGEIVWKKDSMFLGSYDFAIQVNEWRRGYRVGYVIRDYVLNLLGDDFIADNFGKTNAFPVDSQGNYVANLNVGDTLSLSFFYADSNSLFTSVQAYGDAFRAPSPASFNDTSTFDTTFAQLKWIISDSDIRKSPYVFTFRGISFTTGTETDLTFTAYLHGTIMDTCPSFPLNVGMQENNSYNEISVYPVPTKDNLVIAIPQALRDYQLRIFNMMGQIILESEIRNPNSEFKVDVSMFSSGIYFIQLTGEKERWVGKFVKE